MPSRHCFVGYPAAVLRKTPGGSPGMQRIWGSYLRLTGTRQGDWLEVQFGEDRFWIEEHNTQPSGTLELMFLDIGQGDSCLLTTPTNKKIIVDAGAGDNMVRFLKYKYRYSSKPTRFDAAVISHPDKDHYYGFEPVFDHPAFMFETVYHSGLVERHASEKNKTLGRRRKVGGRWYVTDLVESRDELDELLTPARIGKKLYPKMLRKAIDSGRVGDIRMLNAGTGHVPGYGPDDDVTLEVLGPVPEIVSGQPSLRWLRDFGKTKNGHSVIIRMEFGQVSFLLGGDLNIPAEDYLLEHYTGQRVPPRNVDDEATLVRLARRIFESDFAKACHHGSADFSEIFLKAVNARATVISSGDDEPHAHPRADALGTIGKHGRGRRPLVFSTELSRSTRENIKDAEKFRRRLRDVTERLHRAQDTGNQRSITSATRAYEGVLEEIKRSIDVFGAINMRTDGDRVIFAYKIERPRGKSKQWDIYKFERDQSGELEFVSKH